MKLKNLFLFPIVLALGWSIFLSGYQAGPARTENLAVSGINGVNAANTCATSLCHVGNNNFNAAGGSLTSAISGQPLTTSTTYSPGQTYNIQVVVARTGQRRFGFQMSAVDGQRRQAGVFQPTDNRTQVTTSAGIQFIEHSLIATTVNPNGTFSFNWTAPATDVGPVRFNFAGNAANGDGSNSGDFIYANQVIIQPAVITVDTTFKGFELPNLGGASLATDGAGGLEIGYARIQPDAGSTTPSGVEIFGLRQGGVLVTETGVPASPLVTSARIYAEVNGPVNTGVAIANPNDTAATITGNFGPFTIPKGGQIAKFLNEAPFNIGSGTLTINSDVPVSVVGLRGLINERSEFLLTTLPVGAIGVAGSDPVVLPHYADGGGWVTQVVLVNPTDATLTGTVQFLNGAGSPSSVTINSQAASSFNYSVPGSGSLKLATAGSGAGTASGSVRVTPSGGTGTPSAFAVFSFRSAGVTVSEAGVPSLQGSVFRMYVEGNPVGAIQTGIAVANIGTAPATVNLTLTNLDGSSAGLPAPANVPLPGSGQTAKFLNELFPTLALPFKGVLRISTSSEVSVVGLRTRSNERGNFLITTTPPTNEATPASAAEMLFPHLVNGGGYTTQFILFSGTAGQAASGNLRFFRQDSQGLNLNLN